MSDRIKSGLGELNILMNYKFTLALLLCLHLPYVLFARLTGTTSKYAGDHLPALIQAVQPITVCSGATIVILGETPPLVPTSYNWEVLMQGNNWVNAPGVNNAADYLSSALLNTSATDIIFDIRRKITTGVTVAYDSFYEVTVQSSPPIVSNSVTLPANSTFCVSGTPGLLTGSTPAGGNGNFQYRWQSSADNINFTTITGATAKDYLPPLLTSTTYFRRTVNAGNCVIPGISNTIAIVILPAVSNNTITAPSISNFCANGNPGIIAGTVPVGGNSAYVYQWQSSTDNVNFTDIRGATTKEYNAAVINTTTYYRRSVTSGSCAAPVISNTVTINISASIAGNTVMAPLASNFCVSGDPANMIGNLPTGGNGTFSYQWQSSTDNVNFSDLSGATTKDYDAPVINTTTYYRRSVTSGSCTVPVLSNVITIVIAPALANNTIVAPPILNFCLSGDPGIMTGSTPSGGNGSYVYQWQSSTDNTGFTDIVDATGKDFNPLMINTTTYYRRLVSSGSCATLVASNSVKINITPAILANTITAPLITNFCVSGNPASISGSMPNGGDGTYVYQWQSSTDNVSFSAIPDATGKDFDPLLISTTTYYRRLVSSGSCTSPNISNTVKINIAPAILGNTIIAPQTTSFCVSGVPGNISGSTPGGGDGTYVYQWQSSTDNIGFADIADATGKDFKPLMINTTTYYRRLVSSGSCANPLLSNVIVINILTLPTTPVMLLAPSVITIKSGRTASFSIDSQPGITYNWYDSATKSKLLYTGSTFVTPALTTGSTFYVEGSNGLCTSSGLAMAQVKIEPQFADIYVPNAFTPNGDGQNDEIHVHGEFIKTLAFYIYSQWGEMLFMTTDKNRGWDGSYKGKPQPVGVYIYTLRSTLNDGQQITKKGTITLLQ